MKWRLVRRCINTTFTFLFHGKMFRMTTIYNLFSLEVESVQLVLNWTLHTLFTWSEWVTGGLHVFCPGGLAKPRPVIRIELMFTLGEKGLIWDDSHFNRWFNHRLTIVCFCIHRFCIHITVFSLYIGIQILFENRNVVLYDDVNAWKVKRNSINVYSVNTEKTNTSMKV